MNYIILNGVNITTRYGVVVTKLPPITTPAVKTQITETNGSGEEEITFLGYAAYDKTFSIIINKPYISDELIALFTGEGTVTFSNEPTKYYKYHIIQPVVFKNEITVTMRVQPFKYSLIDGVKEFDFEKHKLRIGRYMESKCGIHVNALASTITIKGTGTQLTEWYIPIKPPLEVNLSMVELRVLSQNINRGDFRVGLVRDNKDIKVFGDMIPSVDDYHPVVQEVFAAEPETYNFLYLCIPAGIEFNSNLLVSFQSARLRTVVINNWGNVISKPKMTVSGVGDVYIILKDRELFKINFGYGENLEDDITIDADKMEAYQYGGNVLKNRLVQGDYSDLVLEPGANVLQARGIVNYIAIENFSRWI